MGPSLGAGSGISASAGPRVEGRPAGVAGSRAEGRPAGVASSGAGGGPGVGACSGLGLARPLRAAKLHGEV